MTDQISRRHFLRQMAAGVVGLTSLGVGVGEVVGVGPAAAVPVLALSDGVVTPDPTLCIGCLTCEVICSRVHREQGLSDIPRIRIYYDETVQVSAEIQEHYPDRGQFTQRVCKMCPSPECFYVCPANSLVIDEATGVRYIDEELCIACGRCLSACPFEVPDEAKATGGEIYHQAKRITYDPDANIYVKCDLCHWRAEGPACVERCPVNIRIRQGVLESDHLCLELKPATPENFDALTNV
jgi:Fe-S-cluster-containing dehydrogenase component